MDKFLNYVLVIALLMLANTIFKSAEVIIKREFDFKKFFLGLCKYAFILVGVFMVYYAGTLAPNITVMDNTTILDMINILEMGLIVKYGVACYENLKAIFELKDEDLDMSGVSK